jgi:integrase
METTKKLADYTLLEYLYGVFAQAKASSWKQGRLPHPAVYYDMQAAIRKFNEFVGRELTMIEVEDSMLAEWRKSSVKPAYVQNVRTMMRHLYPSLFPKTRYRSVEGVDDESTLAHICLKVYLAQNVRVTTVTTRKHYEICVKQFSEYLGRTATLGDLNDQSLAGFMRWLVERVRAVTANQRRHYLVAFWRWCADTGLTDVRPTVGDFPEPEVDKTCWTMDQLSRLLKTCENFDRPISRGRIPGGRFWRAWHLVQWDTGERTGAMLSIRWDWVDSQRKLLTIPAHVRKGKRKHMKYYLSDAAMVALHDIKEPRRELVFPMPQVNFYYWYKQFLKRAQLPCGRRDMPQKMRRSHASYLERCNGDATKSLRHSSRAVTEKYYLDESVSEATPPNALLPKISEASSAGGNNT